MKLVVADLQEEVEDPLAARHGDDAAIRGGALQHLAQGGLDRVPEARQGIIRGAGGTARHHDAPATGPVGVGLVSEPAEHDDRGGIERGGEASPVRTVAQRLRHAAGRVGDPVVGRHDGVAVHAVLVRHVVHQRVRRGGEWISSVRTRR